MFCLPVIVPVAVTDFFFPEVGHFHGCSLIDGAAESLDPCQSHVCCGVDVPRRFFAGEDLPCEVVEFPEVAAAVTGFIGFLAHPFPLGGHLQSQCGPVCAQFQGHDSIMDESGGFGAEEPSHPAVGGGPAHEVPYDRAVAHLDQGRAERAQIGHDPVHFSAFSVNAADVQHIFRKCGHFFGAQTGCDHHRTEGVGAVVVIVQKSPPVMQLIPRLDRAAVRIEGAGIAAAVNVVIFGVSQFPEEPFFVEFGHIHIFFGEGIIFRQVVNQPRFLHGFHQRDALCRSEKGGHFAQNVFACFQRFDGVPGVIGAVG